jgi:hypothetical protein
VRAGKWLLNGLTVVIFLIFLGVGAVYALDTPGVVPDLSIWVNNWFKVAMTSTVYHFSDIGVKATPGYAIAESAGKAYIKISGWDTTTPGAEFLVADIYAKESGIWVLVGTVNIYYFAGNNLKFVGSAQVVDPTGTSLSLLFVFKGKRNATNTKFVMDGSTNLSTMGSSLLEIDDAPGSTERWAGSANLSGPMVPVSTLPF